MKKITFILIVLLGISFLISGCKKKDDETPSDSKPQASMSAKIDGVDWTATQMGCSIANDIGGIAGSALQKPSIVISIKNMAVGTFVLNQESESAGAVVDGNVTYTTNQDPQAGGTVIISSLNMTDSLVSGTFEFKAYSFFAKGFIQVTEGIFTNIPLSTTAPVTPNESLKVDIDGTTFTASSVSATNLMGKIIISGSDADYSTIVGITIPEDIEAGTYGFDMTYIGQYTTGTSSLMANSGELIITNHDLTANKIEGTFNFEALNFITSETVSLTNGTFSVSY